MNGAALEVLVIGLAWLAAGVGVGATVGACIRLRDAQVPDDDEAVQ